MTGGTTVTVGNTEYYCVGSEITLAHEGESTGYVFNGYSVWQVSGGFIPVSESEGVYTFTMPAADVTVNTLWRKLLTNSDITITVPAQEYTGNALTPAITVKDGETTLEAGTYYTVGDWSGELINAGTYTATLTGEAAYAGTAEITFTINPAPVTVTADNKAKEYGQADPTLTATVEGLVGTDAVSYTLSREAGEAVGTYTITPTGEASQGNYTVTFVAGTLTITSNPTIALTAKTADGVDDYWTTFYCGDAGYDITTTGAKAYIATYANDGVSETVTLHSIGQTIPQATAVVIVATGGADINMEKNDAATESIGTTATPANHLHGVDVKTAKTAVMTGDLEGCTPFVLSYKAANGDDPTAEGYLPNRFGFFEYAAANLPARKAFLAIDETNHAAKARGLTIVFGDDATGISPAEIAERAETAAAWYTLDGRRLAAKPSKSGLYIVNGKKVAIK